MGSGKISSFTNDQAIKAITLELISHRIFSLIARPLPPPPLNGLSISEETLFAASLRLAAYSTIRHGKLLIYILWYSLSLSELVCNTGYPGGTQS